MKVLMSIAAVLALAVGFSLSSADDANAWCGVGFRWNAAVLVPTPLRRVRRVVVAPSPSGSPCGRVAVAPPPCVRPCAPVAPVVVAPSPCSAPCPTSYYYLPPAYYADYSQPAYGGSCK
jgi:hypothetical protein